VQGLRPFRHAAPAKVRENGKRYHREPYGSGKVDWLYESYYNAIVQDFATRNPEQWRFPKGSDFVKVKLELVLANIGRNVYNRGIPKKTVLGLSSFFGGVV
jgi:hypothetical protein